MTSGAGRSCGTGFCLCFLVKLTSHSVRCLILRVWISAEGVYSIVGCYGCSCDSVGWAGCPTVRCGILLSQVWATLLGKGVSILHPRM